MPLSETSQYDLDTLAHPPDSLHLASQRGDVDAIEHFIGDGVAGANDRDEQDVTPLHWAAINNHVEVCRYLLDHGAEIDAVGGDLRATPLHWAARNGHVYVVDLLLSRGANPALLDSQSFNTLHLAVHSSSALLVCYLLFAAEGAAELDRRDRLSPTEASFSAESAASVAALPANSDATASTSSTSPQSATFTDFAAPAALGSTDTEGHTALHWACYQGDALSVELLLRAGADIHVPDSAGLTPLHWAVVKGNATCITELLKGGAASDMRVRDAAGKLPRDLAAEVKSARAFDRGAADAGFDVRGHRSRKLLPPRLANAAIFALPLLTFCLVLWTVSVVPIWALGLLAALAEAVAMHHIIVRALLGISSVQSSSRLLTSPYLCSLICASIAHVAYAAATRFGALPGYDTVKTALALAILACVSAFARSITADPGHVPRPTGRALRAEIRTLVAQRRFDGMNFCLQCLCRRPLRSRHSPQTGRCTARFDHYCPWVWNDIGAGNHRVFLAFVAFLVWGILLFLWLTVAYFGTLPADPDACDVGGPLCRAGHADMPLLVVAAWSALQLSWTLVLLTVQLWQVARQLTTLEMSNIGKFGAMGGRPGVSAAALGQQGLVDKARQQQAAQGTPAPKKKQPRAGFLLKLLGLDRLLLPRTVRPQPARNPFNRGIFGNCVDFWTMGRGLHVDYITLYDVPGESDASLGETSWGAGWRGRAGGVGGASREGYAEVAQDVV